MFVRKGPYLLNQFKNQICIKAAFNPPYENRDRGKKNCKISKMYNDHFSIYFNSNIDKYVVCI